MRILTDIEAWNRASAYCSVAEHCRSEVADKLQKWGISKSVASGILDRLEKENYINEERFCRAFVNDKYRFSKWGKIKISQALQQKNIPDAIYRPSFDMIDQDEYLNLLRNLLSTKMKNIRAESEYEKNGKLIRFALSRGFEMKDIRLCLRLFDENDSF